MAFHISETPTQWIAEKEMDSAPIDVKEKETTRGLVYFERGIKDGKLVLRRIIYSKEMFPTEKELVDILSKLEEKCPLCKASSSNNEYQKIFISGGISLLVLITISIWIAMWK